MLTSFISLTYNQKNYTLGLAKTLLRRHKNHTFEWVVVDNGKDGTTEALVEFWKLHAKPGQELKALEHDNSGNFASINNAGASMSKGDVLVFLNNDTRVTSDLITPFRETLENYPQVGCVGSVIHFFNRTLQHSGIFIGNEVTPGELGLRAVNAFGFHPAWAFPQTWTGPVPFKAVTAACVAVRRKDFMDIAGFHDEFNYCFEDVDFCFRMMAHLGKICVVDPRARLLHKGSASGGDRRVEEHLKMLRGRWLGIIPPDMPRYYSRQVQLKSSCTARGTDSAQNL